MGVQLLRLQLRPGLLLLLLGALSLRLLLQLRLVPGNTLYLARLPGIRPLRMGERRPPGLFARNRSVRVRCVPIVVRHGRCDRLSPRLLPGLIALLRRIALLWCLVGLVHMSRQQITRLLSEGDPTIKRSTHLRAKRSGHSLHSYGLSPVCALRCRPTCCGRVKVAEHS